MFSAKHIRARKKENKSQNHIIVLFVGFLCLLLVQFVQFIFEFEIQTEENTNKGERSDGDSSISQLQMCVSHVFEIPSLYAISFCILYFVCMAIRATVAHRCGEYKDQRTKQRERNILNVFVGAILGYYVEYYVISIEKFNAFSFHLSKFHVTNYPINKMAWVLLVEKAHTHT